MKGIKTWAISFVRYSGLFLKWTREELRQMDQKTSKLMTMHKALHPRDNVNRLYASRKERGEGLAALKIASIHQYKDLRTTLKRSQKD